MPEIETIEPRMNDRIRNISQAATLAPSGPVAWWSASTVWSFVMIALATSLFLHFPAQAQTQNIELILAERLLVQPNKQTPIAIQIEPSEQLPNGAFVRMRGLPSNATLTQGYRVNKSGTWAVPIKSLTKLRITIPNQIEEPVPVKVQLTTLSGKIYAERQTTLIMGPSPLAPPQLASKRQKSASETRQRAADVIAATSTLAVGEKKSSDSDSSGSTSQPTAPVTANPAASSPAQRLLQRGHSFLLDGNISIARQFYQRSAKLGLATAAIAMASTYDPNELPKLGLVDLPGSKDEARKWYEKAKGMGSPVAEDRLQRLSAE
ncbi:MAG: hypothetical protein AAGD43_37105 [Pseudomonadota bacterium]